LSDIVFTVPIIGPIAEVKDDPSLPNIHSPPTSPHSELNDSSDFRSSGSRSKSPLVRTARTTKILSENFSPDSPPMKDRNADRSDTATQRRYIINEFMSSEQSYVEGLQTIMEGYYKPALEGKFISQDILDQILYISPFKNIITTHRSNYLYIFFK